MVNSDTNVHRRARAAECFCAFQWGLFPSALSNIIPARTANPSSPLSRANAAASRASTEHDRPLRRARITSFRHDVGHNSDRFFRIDLGMHQGVLVVRRQLQMQTLRRRHIKLLSNRTARGVSIFIPARCPSSPNASSIPTTFSSGHPRGRTATPSFPKTE